MAKVLESDIVVSEFELKSRYYFCVWTKIFEKGMNPLIFQAMGKMVPLLSFNKDGLVLNNPQKLIYHKTKKPIQTKLSLLAVYRTNVSHLNTDIYKKKKVNIEKW